MQGWSGPSFKKPNQFAWEEEYRFTINLNPGETINLNDTCSFGRYAPINLDIFLGQIRIHPNSTDSDFKQVHNLIAQHVPRRLKRFRRSALIPWNGEAHTTSTSSDT